MTENLRPDDGAAGDVWPAIPFEDWKDTCATLQLWTQIIGKIRLAQAPRLNHTWQVTLYVTCRGLTTSPMPYGASTFQIDFDFVDHQLVILTSGGAESSFPLSPRPVADFYGDVMAALRELGIEIPIWPVPCELPQVIPFQEDKEHGSYDAGAAHRFWKALVQADRVLKEFRAGFIGKCSPVHFFWGSFDLAVTRFSGRRAPQHPGGVPHLSDRVVRDAYSHEVSSAGFWPGSETFPQPAFYSYAYPEPASFSRATVAPHGAAYDASLREFILPYDTVRQSASPDRALLSFLQTTYQAAADGARWDRPNLEWDPEEAG